MQYAYACMRVLCALMTQLLSFPPHRAQRKSNVQLTFLVLAHNFAQQMTARRDDLVGCASDRIIGSDRTRCTCTSRNTMQSGSRSISPCSSEIGLERVRADVSSPITRSHINYGNEYFILAFLLHCENFIARDTPTDRCTAHFRLPIASKIETEDDIIEMRSAEAKNQKIFGEKR